MHPFDSLSKREEQVAKRLVLGWGNQMIGEALGISHRTVEDYRLKVFQKLGVHNVVGLIRKRYDLDAVDERERSGDASDPKFDAVAMAQKGGDDGQGH